jgi:prephenate dehydrogenase
LAGSVVGIGRRVENLELAIKLGAIDRYERQGKEAVKDADLVVLATPVERYGDHLREWGDSLKEHTIVSDVGSVKGRLVEKVETLLPPNVHFIGAHPIAGKEKSGVGMATPDLFQGAFCILTPTPRTNSHALGSIQQLWETAGSTVRTMDPFAHDWVFGAVSHLPHVVAFTLMLSLSDLQRSSPNPIDLLGFSGGGLRDTTRIAASSPEMWRDICLSNRENLLNMIENYEHHLKRFKTLLENKDGNGLLDVMDKAKQARERLQ